MNVKKAEALIEKLEARKVFSAQEREHLTQQSITHFFNNAPTVARLSSEIEAIEAFILLLKEVRGSAELALLEQQVRNLIQHSRGTVTAILASDLKDYDTAIQFHAAEEASVIWVGILKSFKYLKPED